MSTFHVPSKALCAIARPGVSKASSNTNHRSFFIVFFSIEELPGIVAGPFGTTANIHRRPPACNAPVPFSARRTIACAFGVMVMKIFSWGRGWPVPRGRGQPGMAVLSARIGGRELIVESLKLKVERQTVKSDGREKDNAETQSTQRLEEEDKEWGRCIVPLREQEQAGQAPPLQRKEEEPEWRMGGMDGPASGLGAGC